MAPTIGLGRLGGSKKSPSVKAPSTPVGDSLQNTLQDPLQSSLSDSLQDNVGSSSSDTASQVKPEELKKPKLTPEEQRLADLSGSFASIFTSLYNNCMPPVGVGPIRSAAGKFKSELTKFISEAKGTTAEVPAKQALGLADVISSLKVVPAPKGLGKLIVAQNKAHAKIAKSEEALFEQESGGIRQKLANRRLDSAVKKSDKHDKRLDGAEEEYMKLLEQAAPEIGHFEAPIERLTSIFEPVSTKKVEFNIKKLRKGLAMAMRDPGLQKFEQEGTYTRQDLKDNALGK